MARYSPPSVGMANGRIGGSFLEVRLNLGESGGGFETGNLGGFGNGDRGGRTAHHRGV